MGDFQDHPEHDQGPSNLRDIRKNTVGEESGMNCNASAIRRGITADGKSTD